MPLHDFASAIEAAEVAGLGVYARAVLLTAHDGRPDVVSLRLSCTYDTPGLSVVEVEYLNDAGDALGGFSL